MSVQTADGVTRLAPCLPACAFKEHRWLDAAGVPSGMPRSEAGRPLAEYRRELFNMDAILAAEAFISGAIDNLYIEGSVGSGKTALACAILTTLHAQIVRCTFQRVLDLLRLPFAEIDERIVALTAEPVIVLDDLGADRATDDRSDFGRRELQRLFDLRLDHGRRTIFTSNKSLDELATHYADDRLASRIVGACTVVGIYGPDQRAMLAARKARR